MPVGQILLWGMLFGMIGIAYFAYGKKKDNAVIRFTGIALIFFPYLFTNAWLLFFCGIAIMFAPRFIKF